MLDYVQDLTCSDRLFLTGRILLVPLNHISLLKQVDLRVAVLEDLVQTSEMKSNTKFIYVFMALLLLLAAARTQRVVGKLYKVGDLDAWGIPTSANPHVYTNWPKNHSFKIGDSLLFLYPPSQDSVIQVSDLSFKSCNLENPILYMDNGNSLFNITSNGTFYFTSGESGHCQKLQKLRIAIGEGQEEEEDTSSDAPSYQPAFGNIPSPASSSASSLMSSLTFMYPAIAGFLACLSAIYIH